MHSIVPFHALFVVVTARAPRCLPSRHLFLSFHTLVQDSKHSWNTLGHSLSKYHNALILCHSIHQQICHLRLYIVLVLLIIITRALVDGEKVTECFVWHILRCVFFYDAA